MLFKKVVGDASFGQVSVFFSVIAILSSVLLAPMVAGLHLSGYELIQWDRIPWLHLMLAAVLTLCKSCNHICMLTLHCGLHDLQDVCSIWYNIAQKHSGHATLVLKVFTAHCLWNWQLISVYRFKVFARFIIFLRENILKLCRLNNNLHNKLKVFTLIAKISLFVCYFECCWINGISCSRKSVGKFWSGGDVWNFHHTGAGARYTRICRSDTFPQSLPLLISICSFIIAEMYVEMSL